MRSGTSRNRAVATTARIHSVLPIRFFIRCSRSAQPGPWGPNRASLRSGMRRLSHIAGVRTTQRLWRSLGALVGAIALVGCGGSDDAVDVTTQAGALVCPAGGSIRADPGGDVKVISSRGPERPARMPSADVVSVAIRRGEDGIICVAFRTAGPIRPGSGFALTTRQADGTGGSSDEQRYEIQLNPDGSMDISRPRGEPRYPVRAEVERDRSLLRADMETLLRADQGFEWRAEARYLPNFPLGDVYVDGIPNGGGWNRVAKAARRPRPERPSQNKRQEP